MKKLLLLLCSIGANAAFAVVTVDVNCFHKGNDSGVDIGTLKGASFSTHRLKDPTDYSFMHFLSFTGNYDKYLDKCIMEAKKSQDVLGLKFGNDKYTKNIPINLKYHTSKDLFKDNPKLAAFAEVKAFEGLTKDQDRNPIMSKDLTIKLKIGSDLGFDKVPNLSDKLKGQTFFARPSKIDIFEKYILDQNKTVKEQDKQLSFKDAEAVGLFLSRYLHENNGLLDNLPFSYGLTKDKDKDAVSEVEIKVEKNGSSVLLIVWLYLKPTALIDKEYNPNVMAYLSIPFVLNTKDYSYGTADQKLTIDVSKTGPLVGFYHPKTNKPVNTETNSELLGLMALGMTNLYIAPNAAPNPDKWVSKDMKGL